MSRSSFADLPVAYADEIRNVIQSILEQDIEDQKLADRLRVELTGKGLASQGLTVTLRLRGDQVECNLVGTRIGTFNGCFKRARVLVA